MVKRFGAACLIVLAALGTALAGGLQTRMGEVWLDNVRYGQAFSLRESLNLPFSVTNTSARPVELRMQLQINKPGDKDLKAGFEPLPDPSWVKLATDFFPRVEPNGTAETDIVIEVPKDRKYLGRKYQFYVWTRTTGGLSNINVGVMSRFLVSVISAENLAVLEGRKTKDVVQAHVDFSLLPYEVYVKQLKPGRKYDLEELSGMPLKIVNPNSGKLRFRISAQSTNEAGTFFKDGYADIPDAKFVQFKDREFTVPGESIRRTKAYVTIPGKPEYRGKKYQCILVLETVGQNVHAKVFSRLYITTEE